jgi:hypothetical protein
MKKKSGKVVGMNQPPPAAPNMQLDPTKLDTIRCEECEGIFFNEVTMYKVVPAVQSPNGKKSMLPIPVQRCADCGNVSEQFLPKELLP